MFAILRSCRSSCRALSVYSTSKKSSWSRGYDTNSLLVTNNINKCTVRNKIWTAPLGDDIVKLRDATLDERLTEAIEKHLDEDKNRIIMIHADDENNKLTVSQLKEQRDAVASYLTEHNFSNNFTACVVLPNSIPYAVFHLATMACGGVLSGINPSFTKDEIAIQLADCEADVVFTSQSLLEKVVHATKSVPSIRKIICVGSIPTYLSEQVVDWNSVLKSKGFRPNNTRRGDDLAILPYSSGTTGRPKGVMLTHNACSCGVDVLEAHFMRFLPSWSPPFSWRHQSHLHILPFYHIFGFTLLNVQIKTGGLAVIFPTFDPKLLLSTIEKYKTRHLFAVPPIVSFIANSPLVDEYDISSLELLFSAAAVVGKDLADKVEKKHPKLTLRQGYGLTETSGGCALSLENSPNYSIGCVSSTYQMKIINNKTEELLGPGQTGEICIRGPGIFKEYYKNIEATSNTIKDGWLHTGDLGYANEKGEIFFIDRIKELIKVKGLQVAPAELEDILLGHPGIADAAVVGVPHERYGEAPKALVIRKDKDLSDIQIDYYMRDRVAEHKQLSGGIEFVSSIPRSASGKIIRVQLRKEEEEKRRLTQKNINKE